MFYEASGSIICILSNIYRANHISVIFYKENNPLNIQTTGLKKTDNPLIKETIYDEHFLKNLSCTTDKIKPGHECIFSWDKEINEIGEKFRALHEYELYNGISLIIKQKNDSAWCISACSSEKQNGAKFHERFLMKKDKIKKIIKTYDLS